MRRHRVSSSAFHRDPGPPKELYLSVNSLEVEPLADIAEYYRRIFRDSQGDVGVTVHQVRAYNAAARCATINVVYNKQEKIWEYASEDGNLPAYEYRPGRSPSHCGVEYVKYFRDIHERKFARHLARKKYHLC